MIQSQLPILIPALPLFAALATSVLGLFNRRLCLPIVIFALAASLCCSVFALMEVIRVDIWRYSLGNWPPPIGIEFVIDPLNALVLVLIGVVSLGSRSVRVKGIRFFFSRSVITPITSSSISGSAIQLRSK